jgi:hypothetical protein
MDNFQQPTPPIQPNDMQPAVSPLGTQSPKRRLWIYIVAGIFVLIIAVTASAFFLKNKSSLLNNEKEARNIAVGLSCPLEVDQFIGRILSKQKPFIAEILDYSLEVPPEDDLSFNQAYNFTNIERPLIVNSLAHVTDKHAVKVGDIVLGQYSHETCDAGVEFGLCSYVDILEIIGNQQTYCNNEETLKYVDRKNEVVLALTDYGENSLLTIRANGDINYVDYWGNTVLPRNLKKEDIDSLIQLGRNNTLLSYSNRSREETHRIIISLDGKIAYFTVPSDFTGKVPQEVEAFVTKILAIEKSILGQASYRLTVMESYPLLTWQGQKSFSEYIAQKEMIDYRNDLTDAKLKEIYVYHPNLSDLLKKHGKVFFKEGQRVYEVVIYDFKPNVPVGHEQEETDSGFTGFSYWQEKDIDLKTVSSAGINITDEIVKRNKIQLQSRDDRFIIQEDTVFVVALQRI